MGKPKTIDCPRLVYPRAADQRWGPTPSRIVTVQRISRRTHRYTPQCRLVVDPFGNTLDDQIQSIVPSRYRAVRVNRQIAALAGGGLAAKCNLAFIHAEYGYEVRVSSAPVVASR
ncbi:hypothetical protein GCM10023319_73760 [Nocardia iowensis]